MGRAFLITGTAVFVVLALPAHAKGQNTPGVTEVAPGVRQIDGAKVPSLSISAADIAARIATDNRYKTMKKYLGSGGIDSTGPAGTTTYMYKVRDTDTDSDKVLILFVAKGKIVDHVIA